MKKLLIMAALVGIFSLMTMAYQGASKADCELREAYAKSIDWNSTLGFSTTSTYDANIGALQTGRYWLSSDLVTGRLVIDQNKKPVFDLGEGRTMTIIGQGGNLAIGTTVNGSGSTFQLKSGSIVFPYSYEGVTTTYPILGIPRGNDNKALHDSQFIVGGGPTEAKLFTRDIQMQYGTNNWLVVTNNGRIVVSGSGTQFFTDSANDGTGTRNGIRVTDGGVYSNAWAGASLAFSLFGRSDSTGNVFEVTDGGRLDGWERFELKTSSGNMFAFRGVVTHQVFDVTNKNSVCFFNGRGNRLEVTDGAQLEIKTGSAGRGRVWIGTSEYNWSNVLHVAGSGSTFSCAANGNLIGQSCSAGNRVEVSDGGVVVIKETHIGQTGTAAKPAKGNVVRVTTGGTFTDSSTLLVGYGENNTSSYVCSNRLEVASGGTVNAAQLQVGFSAHSWGNVVDVDGGTVNVTRNFILSRFGHDSRMKVHDGGKVTVGEGFTFGVSSEGFASNNVMEVLTGGEVVANEFIVYGTNHMLVVSNGTVRTRNVVSSGIQLPWFDNARDWDFTLEVAGTNPVLRAEGTTASVYTFGIRRGAKVLFRVPRDGYVEPPLQAPNGLLGIFGDGNGHAPDIRFDVSACGGHSVRCVIAEGNPLQIDDAVMSLMRSNLPENCKLKVVDNKLILKVNEFGTQILFR